MKNQKSLSIITIVLFLTVFCTAVSSPSFGASAAAERSVAFALYTETAPDFDCIRDAGEIDPVWENIPAHLTDEGYSRFQNGGSAPYATGYFKAMWDEGNLYFLAVIYDETPAEYDMISFWVSEQNTMVDRADSSPEAQKAAWATSDGDYILPVLPNMYGGIIGYYDPFNSGDPANAVGKRMDDPESYGGELAVGFTEGGYIVQLKIPFQTEFLAVSDYEMGFAVSVDDYYSGSSSRKAYCAWFHEKMGNSNYWDGTNGLGILQFVRDGEGLPVLITVSGNYPPATIGAPVDLMTPVITDYYGSAIAEYTVTVKNMSGTDVTGSVYDAASKKLTFSEAGTYTVIYSASDSFGNYGTLEKTITAATAGGGNNGNNNNNNGNEGRGGCSDSGGSAIALIGVLCAALFIKHGAGEL